MKKIGFLILDMMYAGGAQSAMSVLVNNISDWYDIDVISVSKCSKPAYNIEEKIKIVSLSHRKNLRLRESIQFNIIYNLRKHILDNGIETLVLVGSELSVFLLVVLYIKGLKTIVWDHTSYHNKFKRSFIKSGGLAFLGMQLANKTITLTQENVDFVLKHGLTRSDKIGYIYNIAQFPKTVAIEKEKIIITVARIDPVKGLDLLLKVANRVFEKVDNWKWFVWGQIDDKKYEYSLREMIKKLGLEKKVLFKGHTDNIQTEYQRSSLCVMTSRYEGLPMSLLEAKAHGLPIVAFNCKTGPSEIIENGVSGYIVPCYDIDVMADKIHELIENPCIRKKFSNHASDNLYKFTASSVIKEWKKIL